MIDKSDSELVLAEGVIPTPAAIHAAKKKRELARNYSDDIGTSTSQSRFKNAVPFNPISDDENSDDGVMESRTVRQFGVACDTSKQMEVLSALDNADSGSDEEKFNEEQIFKGVNSFPLPCETSETCATSDLHVPSITFTPISVESLQSKFKSQLSYLKDQLSDNNNSTTKLTEDMKATNEEIITLDSHSQALAIKYQFFQEMRCHIRDLLLCLTEKVFETVNRYPCTLLRNGQGQHDVL